MEGAITTIILYYQLLFLTHLRRIRPNFFGSLQCLFARSCSLLIPLLTKISLFAFPSPISCIVCHPQLSNYIKQKHKKKKKFLSQLWTQNESEISQQMQMPDKGIRQSKPDPLPFLYQLESELKNSPPPRKCFQRFGFSYPSCIKYQVKFSCYYRHQLLKILH